MGKPGMRKAAPIAQRQARARMWNSMRQLRVFTRADLVATADAGESHVSKYTRALRNAGYLAVVAEHRSGVAAGHEQYRLINNTGPVAPRVSKDGIFDFNLACPRHGVVSPASVGAGAGRAGVSRTRLLSQDAVSTPDPYDLAPSKHIARHAHALLKALREVVDEGQHHKLTLPALVRAASLLSKVDGDQA